MKVWLETKCCKCPCSRKVCFKCPGSGKVWCKWPCSRKVWCKCPGIRKIWCKCPWSGKVWCKCPGSRKVWCKCTGNPLEKPTLLLFDQFRSGVTERIKRMGVELNVQLAVIPGGLTSQLQTLYVLSTNPINHTYVRHGPNGWRHHVTFWHEREWWNTKPFQRFVCAWINSLWACVNHEPSVQSFKKYEIGYTPDGNKDGAVSKKVMADYNIHNNSVTLTASFGFYIERQLHFTLAF